MVGRGGWRRGPGAGDRRLTRPDTRERPGVRLRTSGASRRVPQLHSGGGTPARRPDHSIPSRGQVGRAGDHPADRAAGVTRRCDPAVGGRCTVSEHGTRHHLGSGRRVPSRAPAVPHRRERGGPLGTSVVTAAPCGSPPGGGHVARAAAPPILADERLVSVTRCVGCHHHLGGTAPLWLNGRPLGLPLGGSPLAGFDRCVAVTFRGPHRRAGALHLHPVAPVRSSWVSDRGSAVRSRPARANLRRSHRRCPGGTRKSQDVHRSSPSCPQEVGGHARTSPRRARFPGRAPPAGAGSAPCLGGSWQ